MTLTKVVWRVLVIAGALAVPLAGDTVTLRNNKSYSGTVVGFSANILHVEGNFEGKSKRLDVPLASISVVEFNDVVDNVPAAPPFGAHEVKAQPRGAAPQRPAPAEELQTDVLVLLGGQRVKCSVTLIDKNVVRCGDSDYDRDRVYRIEFKKR